MGPLRYFARELGSSQSPMIWWRSCMAVPRAIPSSLRSSSPLSWSKAPSQLRRDVCRARRGGEIEIPRSIRSVVGERVGRLPAEAQALLRLASVIGPEFDLDVLLAASGQPEASVLDALDAWLDARVLEERQGSGGRDRYGFKHALIHLTLYEELPTHRRRRSHMRVASALESLRPLPATASADLARHFLLGGNTAQAARYAVQAAEQPRVGTPTPRRFITTRLPSTC
jgi:hypothetical protein